MQSKGITNPRNTKGFNEIFVYDLADWIYRYYIDPIIHDTSYNPVDTVTWAIVLGLAVLGLVRLFQHLKLEMDERLALYTLPFVLAGSSLRVIEDARLVSPPASYLLITPLIFFVVFFVAASCLLLSRMILGAEFYRAYAAIGLIWTALNLAFLTTAGFQNLWVIPAVFLLGTTITAGILLVRRRLNWLRFLDDKFNLMIIYAHMLDASSTYIGVDWFSYYEKHVVPTFLINLTGSSSIMYPLKLLVLLPALSIIDRSIEDPSLRNLTKLTLITLGLAPAARNALRLALGV
ncbi:MAG TPA: DUF63 family protein [Methanothrix sp.]|nr:DUF63 family protein [Methanothrix sp.]